GRRHSLHRGEELQVLVGVEALVEPEEVGHVAEVAAHHVRLPLGIRPRNRHRSAVPGEKGAEYEHGGRLASPIRPDQPEDASHGHGEVEAAQGHDTPVALLHRPQLDHDVSHTSARSLGLIGLSPNSFWPTRRTYTSPSGEIAPGGTGLSISNGSKAAISQFQASYSAGAMPNRCSLVRRTVRAGSGSRKRTVISSVETTRWTPQSIQLTNPSPTTLAVAESLDPASTVPASIRTSVGPGTGAWPSDREIPGW